MTSMHGTPPIRFRNCHCFSICCISICRVLSCSLSKLTRGVYRAVNWAVQQSRSTGRHLLQLGQLLSRECLQSTPSAINAVCNQRRLQSTPSQVAPSALLHAILHHGGRAFSYIMRWVWAHRTLEPADELLLHELLLDARVVKWVENQHRPL